MTSFKELPYLAQIGIVALVILLLAAGAYMYCPCSHWRRRISRMR